MGVKVTNSTGGLDFATNEHYFEFHRRIVVPGKDWNDIMALLESKDYQKARKALKAVAPQNAHAMIDLALKELVATQKG